MEQTTLDENQKIDHSHDQEILKEIFEKRSQQPRKSWFGQECEKKTIEKRLSQIFLDSNQENEEHEFKKGEKENI